MLLGWGLTVPMVHAQEQAGEEQAGEEQASEGHAASNEFQHSRKHHLSVLLADTRLLLPGEEDEDAFTIGIDYEYRLNYRFGAGVVAEYAVDPLDATTFLGALDVHLYKGLVMQLGVGVEFIEGDANELGRIGMLYEFEFGHLTFSPQLHWDVTSAEDSVVFGFAIGRNF